MLQTLQNAIENRLLVEIDYEPGLRTIEPHALGRGKQGQFLLRAFQVDGASASGETPHWKLFRVDRIRAADSNGASFKGPRPEYRRGDKAMSGGIIAEL